MENEEEYNYDLTLRVGELTGEVRGLCKELKATNDLLSEIAKEVDRHKTLIDKALGWVAGVAIICSLVFSFLADWFKGVFHKA